jgi:DNA-binding response OmpR family regulator
MFDIEKYRENRKTKVLLVEDDETLGKIYLKALERLGYKVCLVQEGKKAIKVSSEKKFGLVILDLMLPDISGIDILKDLRKKKNRIEVIVLTNVMNENILNECRKLSVTGLLSKSDFTPFQIVDYIEQNFSKT